MNTKRFFTTLPTVFTLLGSAGFSPHWDDHSCGRSEGIAMPKPAKPVGRKLLISRIRTAVTLLFLTPFLYLSAQTDHPDRVPGEIIVRLVDGVNVEEWASTNLLQKGAINSVTMIKELGIRHPLVLLAFDENQIPPEKALLEVQQLASVVTVQYNYYVDFRTQPNDSQYFSQWDMEIIEAPSAWDHTTGGTTDGGTPIVVAVMDSGFDINHEDLAPNLWVNTNEVPADGIDNDNNGYVDDLMGWDYFSDTPNVAPGNHGLSTASIIGAKGNNGVGVTGVNWDIDLMLFSFSSVADLVSAYEYVIDQRQRFNESNGLAGAFVVATNNSFGQARIWCDQQPVWGSMYDLMGEVGILSSAGVDNNRYDVDNAGDMPATCPSDYLLVSCNTDEDDNLFNNSAYGATSVDIGAPGEGTFTVKPGNSYGVFGGNSAATPHVTGAIALLYSAPVAGLEASAITQPAATARLVKNLLVQSGDLLPSLENRTLSGRRLNLGNGMEQLMANFSNQLKPLAINKLFPNPVKGLLTVNYDVPENGTYRAEIYNALGQRVQHQEEEVGEGGLRIFTIDTNPLPAGVYFLNFGRAGEWVTERIIVI